MFSPFCICGVILALFLINGGHCIVRTGHSDDKDTDIDTLKSDLLKVKQQCSLLAGELSTLKSHLGIEKEHVRSLDSAQQVSGKQIEVLKEVIMKGTGSCVLENSTEGNHKGETKEKDRWSFEMVTEINVTVGDDEKTATVFDVVVLVQEEMDVVVVSDHGNKCVKSFWFDPQQNRYLHSRLSLDMDLDVKGYVGKFAKLSETQIVVTFSVGSVTFLYLLTSKPELSLHSVTINKRHFIGCIAAMPSNTETRSETRLLIGHDDGLEIINLKNDVIKSIDLSADKFTSHPFFVSMMPSGNVVASNGLSGVFAVTQGGEELWRYPMASPMDVDCDEEGNVYVANIKQNKVIVLSPDGKLIKEVLTKSKHGIYRPAGISYNSANRRLYIAEFNGVVKIFERQA